MMMMQSVRLLNKLTLGLLVKGYCSEFYNSKSTFLSLKLARQPDSTNCFHILYHSIQENTQMLAIDSEQTFSRGVIAMFHSCHLSWRDSMTRSSTIRTLLMWNYKRTSSPKYISDFKMTRLPTREL
jgi:hypothetical protein